MAARPPPSQPIKLPKGRFTGKGMRVLDPPCAECCGPTRRAFSNPCLLGRGLSPGNYFGTRLSIMFWANDFYEFKDRRPTRGGGGAPWRLNQRWAGPRALGTLFFFFVNQRSVFLFPFPFAPRPPFGVVMLAEFVARFPKPCPPGASGIVFLWSTP